MNTTLYNPKNTILLQEQVFSIESMNTISFSEYIKEKREDVDSPSWKIRLTTRELAEKVGITYEQFRKIINMNKPTKKRDCIIAICAALEMTSSDTNKALILYQFMPTLNNINPRDNYLIGILNAQKKQHLSIDAINKRLLRNGYPELDIIDHRSYTTHSSKRQHSPYRLLEKKVRIFSDDLIFGDQYNSLSAEYSPYRYRCLAEMWLDDEVNNITYHLSTDTNHNYYMQLHGSNFSKIKSFKSPADSKDFKDFFLELEMMADQELKKMYNTLNDTKNYLSRSSAGIYNDSLHIYAETYNFTVPELSEYYLLEYKNGKTVFSVLHSSEFLRLYLQPKEYSKIYGNTPITLIEKYNSIEEIENQDSNVNKELISCRIKYFKMLKEQVDNLMSDIQNQRKYIRHLDSIYEDHDKVCDYFGVAEEFECTISDDMMFAGRDSVTFKFDDCGTVNVTLEDLYKSFELGFNTINEICRVKKNLGSIEKILY